MSVWWYLDDAVMVNRGTRGQPYSGDRGEIL